MTFADPTLNPPADLIKDGTDASFMADVIEASKQCGRDTLMEIGAPASVAAVVAGRAADVVGLVADPRGQLLAAAGWPEHAEVIGLVGPEGGFSPAELALADSAGWPRVALGPHVLRIETAAVALAARLAAPVDDRASP